MSEEDAIKFLDDPKSQQSEIAICRLGELHRWGLDLKHHWTKRAADLDLMRIHCNEFSRSTFERLAQN